MDSREDTVNQGGHAPPDEKPQIIAFTPMRQVRRLVPGLL